MLKKIKSTIRNIAKKIVDKIDNQEIVKEIKQYESDEFKDILNPDFVNAISLNYLEKTPAITITDKKGVKHQYYTFGGKMANIAMIRFEQAREFDFQHTNYGCTRELLFEKVKFCMERLDINMLQAYEEEEFRTNSRDVWVALNTVLSSLAFTNPLDKYLDILSCLYIDCTESPYIYDRQKAREKISLWLENFEQVDSFFLHKPFMDLISLEPQSFADSQRAMMEMEVIKENMTLEEYLLQKVVILETLKERTQDLSNEIYWRDTTMSNRAQFTEQMLSSTTNT